MSRIRHKYASNFTTISNAVIKDTRLSYKARGIFLYLWHLPPNWEISHADLRRHSDNDGQHAVQTGVEELVRYGYITIKHVRGAKGAYTDSDWLLDDCPGQHRGGDYPDVENQELENRVLDNAGTPKTEDLKTEDLKTEEREEELLSAISPGAAADGPPEAVNGQVVVATLPHKKKGTPQKTTPLAADDWLRDLLYAYADNFDVVALDDNDWWANTGNSLPTFEQGWVSMAFADLARWLSEHRERRPYSRRGWRQRMAYSLNRFYDKHARRTS